LGGVWYGAYHHDLFLTTSSSALLFLITSSKGKKKMMNIFLSWRTLVEYCHYDGLKDSGSYRYNRVKGICAGHQHPEGTWG